MSEVLLLVGGDEPEAEMRWARFDDAGKVSSRGEIGPGAALPAPAPAHIVLAAPGAEVRMKLLALPARTQAQARAGAPFMFEGALAESEDMHWAVGAPQNEDGLRLVAAMSAQRLRDWLKRCSALGAQPQRAMPEFALVPVPPGEIMIVVTPERAIISAGPAGGFSIEPELAPMVFARWLAQAQLTPSRIMLMGGDAQAWRAALGAEGHLLEAAPAPDILELFARGAAAAPSFAPNLLQGAFAAEAGEKSPLKLWRFAALLAAAAFVLQVGSLVIAGVRDAQAARQITAVAEADFRTLQPGRIVNLRAQVTALSNQMAQAGRHPLLTLSEPLAAALRQQPTARVDEVGHEAPGRSVRVLVSASEQNGLEAMIAALRAGGIKLQRRDVPPREGRFSAELIVEAPL